MLLRTKPIVISQENPFANDQLDLKDTAEALKNFISSSQDPLVICIDAAWGQGKTTFLKMWKQLLRNDGFPVIYFNAWENDFTTDALVALIGELDAAIKEAVGKEHVIANQHLEITKKIGSQLFKSSLPLTAQMLGCDLLNASSEQSISSVSESIAREQIEKYEDAKKSLQNFRENLKKLVSSVSTHLDPAEKPLIFIIDELDRCRPNFAIEILEKAKHIFNVENIVFILGADKRQLGSSVKTIYGEDLDVDGYLKRFIDFNYMLPEPEKGLFVKFLFKKHGFDNFFNSKVNANFQYEYNQSIAFFSALFELFKMTLHDQEQCCSILSAAIRVAQSNDKIFPIYLCFLIALKVMKNEVYTSFVKDGLSPDDLINHVSKLTSGEDFLNTDFGAHLEFFIITSFLKTDIKNELKKIEGRYQNNPKINKDRASKVIEKLNHAWQDGGIGILHDLVRKIEIASRFGS
ncbi:MAG: P-loop NTPase fold protein [Pseudomonadota bacterium]